jgi:hypothetical protein
MVGKPTIRGLRITVEQILKGLAGGVSPEESLKGYPELERRISRPSFCMRQGLLKKNACMQ